MSKISSTSLLYFIQKRFVNTVSSSTLPLGSVSTIEFLKNSCGLACRNLLIDEKNPQKYEAIISFFKLYGFENSQIAKLVSLRPAILHSSVSKNLKPKIEFLEEIGIVGPLLPKAVGVRCS
ncbi:unnamed protein product [Citrullus colocynthis]|uniref:Uncharacterized protein n=1 Tax=Citrullus colocynthis TaxID=252529 RepID=A0ABP0YZ72_9ROSI